MSRTQALKPVLPPSTLDKNSLVPVPSSSSRRDRTPIVALEGRLTLHSNNRYGGSVQMEIAKSGCKPFSLDQIKLQHAEEVKADYQGVAQRYWRLYLRALPLVIGGIHRRSEEASKLPTKDEPWAQITAADIYNLLSQGQGKEAFSRTGPMLPAYLRVGLPPIMNKCDRELISDLTMAMLHGPYLRETEKVGVEDVVLRIRDLFRSANESLAPGLFADSVLDATKLECLWEQYRILVKDVAGLLERGNWHSPIHGGKQIQERGLRQTSTPFLDDYQRNVMPEVQAFERNNPYPAEEGHRVFDFEIKNLVFNSGIQAITNILRMLTLDRGNCRGATSKIKSAPLLVANQIYFEVDEIVSNHCEDHGINIVKFNPGNSSEVLKLIKEHKPLGIFIAPVGNSFFFPSYDIWGLLKGLATDKRFQEYYASGFGPSERRVSPHKLHIVIDNTLLGPAARWLDFPFPRLPKRVAIYGVESLVKYHQDGLDLVQAGAVRCIGKFADSDIRRLRNKSGDMPTENAIRKLSLAVQPDLISKEFVRHSRNAQILANAFQEMVRDPRSIVQEVHCPAMNPSGLKKSKGTIAGGALLSIGFRKSLLNGYLDGPRDELRPRWPAVPSQLDQDERVLVEVYRKLLIDLARTMNVDLNVGTGFGFRHTRIAIYARSEERSDSLSYPVPFLRIAAGRENIADITQLAAIFRRAASIISQAIENGNYNQLKEVVRPHESKITW